MSTEQVVRKEFFQKTKLNKIRRMCLSVSGNVVTTEWGFIDSDKVQSTTETCSGLFYPGHASYKTPEEHAMVVFDRWCKQFIVTGNKEKLEDADSSDPTIDLILFPLSREFRAPKAISKKPCVDKDDPEKCHVPNKKMQALIDNCRIIAEKKYNGLRGLIVKSAGQWHVYTIAIKLADEQYPWLKEWFEKYADNFVPEDTIIDVEIVANDATTIEEYETIKSMKPNTSRERAAEILDKWIKKDQNNSVGAVLHNLIMWGGVNMLKAPYVERMEALRGLVGQALKGSNGEGGQQGGSLEFVKIRLPWMSENFYEAVGLMTKEKWEGLVLYDKFASSEYSMNAQFYRPEGCWKWKNLEDDDFIVVGTNEGGGKNCGKASSFKLAQYDKKGNLVDCGSVFSGITNEMIEDGLDLYIGKVVRVSYPSRYGKGTKKGLPTIMHGRIDSLTFVRDEKKPEECVYDPDGEGDC